jgi:NhaA family Na+:H+ antiporter
MKKELDSQVQTLTTPNSSKMSHQNNHNTTKQNSTLGRLRITNIFRAFFQNQQSSGVLLVLFTAASLFIANSIWSTDYIDLWKTEFGWNDHRFHLHHSVTDWINDGLMTLFFLLVGIEIKRELVEGELSNRKRAMLPVLGALGGMVVPALIYFLINFNSPETIAGMGIPTATDIAFAIAILGMLGNKVPTSLKVFLTALAIIDDLGAIVIIALFYGQSISWGWMGISLLIIALIYIADKKDWHYMGVYVVLGFALWFSMLHSGIHATIAGVVLAFMLPRQTNAEKKLANRIEHALSNWVSFLILPLFAAANTAIFINVEMMDQLISPISLGIFFGLFLGKPLGIFGMSVLSHKLGWAEISSDISMKKLWAAGMLGGIGFTMSIFVANLAFTNSDFINLSKLSIIITSVTAASLGYLVFSRAKN